MDIFNPHKKPDHVGTEILAKKKQEYKFLGSSIKRPGQKLWGLDHKTIEVYEIDIKTKTVVKLKGEEIGQHKAYLKAGDHMLWSLNETNAIRKFKKAVNEDKRDQVHARIAKSPE